MKTKTDYLKLFMYELILVVLVFASFVFLRIKLKNYLQIYSSYISLMSSMQDAVLDNTQNIAQLSGLINDLDKITNNYLLLAFVVIPLAIFLFYCVFEGLVWKNIINFRDNKIFFRNFSILSFAGFALIYFTFYLLWDKINISEFDFDVKLIWFPVVVFVVLYLLTIFYSILDRNLTRTLKIGLRMALSKFHLMIIPFLIYFVFVSALIVSMFSIIVYYLLQTSNLQIYIYFILLIATIIASVACKVYLKNRIQKLILTLN